MKFIYFFVGFSTCLDSDPGLQAQLNPDTETQRLMLQIIINTERKKHVVD